MRQFREDYLLLSSYLYTGNEELIKPVNIISYKEICNFDYELLSIFKKKECFSNSQIISNLFPDIEYIEGEVLCFNSFPVIHAWNKYKDKYFDITWELFNKEAFDKSKYIPIVQGTIIDLIEQGYDFKSHVDLFTQWLNSEEVRKQIPNSPFQYLIEQQ